MSVVAAAAAAVSVLAAIAGGLKGKVPSGAVSIPAVARGRGIDGPAFVRAWPGGWKVPDHAKNVFKAMAAGMFGPWRWVPVKVDPRLTILTMHDALAIGDSPPARIPINASNCQRLADRLGKQLGRKLLLPTPKIVDAVHLCAVKGNGRAIEMVSVWDPVEKGETRDNKGQDVGQWLRQQERIQRAVSAAGGYPAAGVLSTVCKNVTLGPRLTDIARAGDTSGQEPGAKMTIYGWHRKAKPVAGKNGPFPPHAVGTSIGKELLAAGWLSVQQSESGVHCDLDTGGDQGAGGFWDYASGLVLCADDCLLDGKLASLSDVYQTLPGLVYAFGGLTKAIPARYPMVPVSVA